MSLESSIQALADAINSFTEVYKNKEFSVPALNSAPPDKPKKGRPKKEKPAEPSIDTDKSPYRDHPSDASNRDDLIKIVRQEFARVVKSCGEKVGQNLLDKYEIPEIEQIKDADVSSFLTEASTLADEGKSGVTVTEVTFDRIKHILTKVYTEKGEKVTVGLLDLFGCAKLTDLKEEDYPKVYEKAEKILA